MPGLPPPGTHTSPRQPRRSLAGRSRPPASSSRDTPRPWLHTRPAGRILGDRPPPGHVPGLVMTSASAVLSLAGLNLRVPNVCPALGRHTFRGLAPAISSGRGDEAPITVRWGCFAVGHNSTEAHRQPSRAGRVELFAGRHFSCALRAHRLKTGRLSAPGPCGPEGSPSPDGLSGLRMTPETWTPRARPRTSCPRPIFGFAAESFPTRAAHQLRIITTPDPERSGIVLRRPPSRASYAIG